MPETRTFLRYVTPGIVCVLLAVLLLAVANGPQVFGQLSVGIDDQQPLATLLGALVASGGLG